MNCPNCNHTSDGGKFCGNCGAPLSSSTHSEIATNGPTIATQQPQPNAYFQSTKTVSTMYFNFFLQVLKKPYASSQSVGGEHFVNAIITIILYAIFIPLIIYFGVKSFMNGISDATGGIFGNTYSMGPSFTDFVLKPMFGYAVFILLVATFVFAAIMLGKIEVTYKSVIARFGSFLIPFLALFVVALILSIFNAKIYIFLFLLGFIGSIFIVPPLVIASYKKETQGGLDTIYGTLLTYILTFITLAIMTNVLFGALKSILLGGTGGFFGL